MKRTLRPAASSEAMQLRERAHRIIPAGSHTYSKGDDQFPSNAPPFIRAGRGARVWDTDGAEFLDWGMGLRSVILGHAYPRVIEAVAAQLPNGSNFVRPSPLEVELAERLIELIPCAEMVKFAKNGSDVTTAAIRLARAATGRDLIVCADQPFFSVDDWFIATTPVDAGVPAATKQLTLTFRYNALESLRDLFRLRVGEIAAVILEPMATEWPAPGFLEGVRELCTTNGAVLIFDEMITGFRFGLHGLQHRFGVTPDLATFGKSIANGFSVAALVGRREIMDLGGIRHDKPRVFLLSTTHGGETHELAAALATIAELEERHVAERIWEIGAQLVSGFDACAAELGIASQARSIGAPCSPSLVFTDKAGVPSADLRTLFMQELVTRGILMPYIAPSFSHTEADVAETLAAVGEALVVVKLAIDQGVQGLLDGASVRPVFRRFN